MFIENAPEKVWEFIMLLKSNRNKNFVTNKQKL